MKCSTYTVRAGREGAASLSDMKDMLAKLTDLKNSKNDQIEDIYASLNINDSFPELQHLPYEFVRTLVLLRDLKINIRKRAIASFFEWDKLDRAAGGRRGEEARRRRRH